MPTYQRVVIRFEADDGTWQQVTVHRARDVALDVDHADARFERVPPDSPLAGTPVITPPGEARLHLALVGYPYPHGAASALAEALERLDADGDDPHRDLMRRLGEVVDAARRLIAGAPDPGAGRILTLDVAADRAGDGHLFTLLLDPSTAAEFGAHGPAWHT
jgi:hypothetical protein